MDDQPLAGRTIAVPETREIDLFASMLEKRGAKVLRCPLIEIRDAPDPTPVLAWCRRVAGSGCDDLVLLTGEGLRRILSCIDRHAPTLRDEFVAALGRVRRITRGPKPARALRELQLKPDIEAATPTTAGVIESLRHLDLQGRRVGVQLYGSDPNRELVEFLTGRGAEVLPVAPYVYGDAADESVVRELLAQMRAGGVDAIAFTSGAQVERLFALEAAEAVRAALGRTVVAAVGPVVAAALRRRGVEPRLMPAESFFLKPLTTVLESALGSAPGTP